MQFPLSSIASTPPSCGAVTMLGGTASMASSRFDPFSCEPARSPKFHLVMESTVCFEAVTYVRLPDMSKSYECAP